MEQGNSPLKLRILRPQQAGPINLWSPDPPRKCRNPWKLNGGCSATVLLHHARHTGQTSTTPTESGTSRWNVPMQGYGQNHRAFKHANTTGESPGQSPRSKRTRCPTLPASNETCWNHGSRCGLKHKGRKLRNLHRGYWAALMLRHALHTQSQHKSCHRRSWSKLGTSCCNVPMQGDGQNKQNKRAVKHTNTTRGESRGQSSRSKKTRLRCPSWWNHCSRCGQKHKPRKIRKPNGGRCAAIVALHDAPHTWSQHSHAKAETWTACMN